MSRLLIVSNRLPVTLRRGEDGLRFEPSSGGLATGLASLHARGDGLWIGWGGDASPETDMERAEIGAELSVHRLVPVTLSPIEVERFYEGLSNGILWPVFHYQTPPFQVDVRDWEAYQAVNERFAEVVANEYQEGDRIWVHDYQLLLVPELLRRHLPCARIGFFLHIPFPSSEVFRTLPQRERLLTGMLGADVIGFHTAAYMRCFAAAVMRILGVIAEVDHIRLGSREVTMGVYPMGIDARGFAAVAAAPAVEEEARALRGDAGTEPPAGNRSSRLHEGHPAPPARLRMLA